MKAAKDYDRIKYWVRNRNKRGIQMQNLGKEFQKKYKLLSVRDEKETYSLYEVEEIGTGHLYVVKYYRLSLFSQSLGALKQQLEKLAADETEFLPVIYDIEEEDNELYVVTEKIEGYKLSDLINRKEKYDVVWVLRLIKKIAEGIQYFFRNGVAMYLVNPKNIFIDMGDKGEKLSIKFSELVSGEYVEEKDGNFMMEQAVYMAPEQVGINRKKFDIRSDLYSLGVIAYQLLAGRLPFRAKSLNQYMYLQIAQIPSSISQYNLDVNTSIDQMVLCLLEKDPANRYQSIESLLYDIREYLNGNVNFTFKAYDTISKITFHEKDFLPCRQINQLEALIRENKGFVVVSGEKNTGKSVVLDLVKLESQNQKNVLLYGECGHEPFQPETIWRLLAEYRKVFDNYPMRRKDILRQEVARRNNISREIICTREKYFDVFFEEDFIASACSEDALENLLNLWQAISEVEDPLTVILENLALDEVSNELLLRFYGNFKRIFLAVSSRQAAPGSEQPDLSIELEKLTQADVLETLNKVSEHRLEDAAGVAEYVYQRSKGNIYLSTEVANWLFQKDALTYREGRWRINPLVLIDLGLPIEIAEEIISRSSQLSAEAEKLLAFLAALEDPLPWTYVKRAAEREGVPTDKALTDLEKEQFVEQRIKDTVYYTFTDKEIYHHFRRRLSKDEIRYYSEKIAEVLEAEYLRFGKAEEAIAMTHYYLRAQNNEKIKAYSLEAAQFLKDQGKNEQAIEALSGFLNALEYQDDEIELFYKAQKMVGEIYTAEGRPDEAQKTFEELLKLNLSAEMKADILEERSWVAFYKGNFAGALHYVKEALKEKKIYLPGNSFQLYVGILIQLIIRIGQSLLGDVKITSAEKPNRSLRQNINQNIWWVSLMVDIRYFAYFSLWMTNRSWSRHKISQELALSYFNMGQMLMGTPLRGLADRYFAKGVRIAEEIGDDHITMISYTLLAYKSEVLGDYENQLNYALMALQLHKKLQFSPFHGLTINALIHAYNYLGDFSNMLRYNDFYQKKAYESGDNYGVISADIYYVQYYRGQGNTVSAVKAGQKALALAEETNDYFDQFCSLAELGVTYFYANQDDKAIECFEKAMAIKKGRFFPLHYTLLAYSYYAMALCRKQKRIQQDFPEDKSLMGLIQQMMSVPLREKKYPTYYGAALRAQAEWHVLCGNPDKAKKYYQASIDHFIKYKRQWLTASTQMAYGKFLMETGEHAAAIQQFILAEYNFRNLKVEAYALIAQREMESLQTGFGGVETEFDKFQRRLQLERNNMFFMDLIRDLSSVLDYQELIQKMIMVLLEASGAQQVAVFLPVENSNQLKMEEFYTNEKAESKKEGMSREMPMKLIRMVLQTKEVLTLDNAEKSEYAKIDEMLAEKHIKSLMLLPVIYKENLRAICYLENSLSTGIFTKEIVENMKIVAGQMAISMENATLYKIATTDDLTGLYTRKHFDYLFQEELRLAVESGSNVGVVFIDIDKFKRINDTYGHMVGDKVLIELSAFLKGNCRTTDVIGRFGGEEIILLLRGNSLADSYKFAERLRRKLETFPIDTGSETLNITASFGVSSYPENGETMTELINKADTALYRSKNEGRNRVTCAK